MPPEAFALVGLFSLLSIVIGVVAWWLARGVGGPRGRRWVVLPVVAAFGAFYVIGHRLGLAVGPEWPILGFQVALLGDVGIGLVAALAVALLQAALVPRRSRPG